MTYRFDLQTGAELSTIFFQGRLDRSALSELETHCRTLKRRGLSVRVLLGAGTTVEIEVLDLLAHIEGIVLEADSPFLSRWIRSCRDNNGAGR